MPMYLYECRACGTLTERSYAMADMPHKIKCGCGKMASRAIVNPNVIDRHRLGEARIGRGKGGKAGYFGKGK